ncbi:MAG: LLM class F420-dependent oxidoreductase [Acidimicrobiia bacterium]|nr:LLM class F420-dependent oxidoreductase [Acidimicrobiia bacterium]
MEFGAFVPQGWRHDLVGIPVEEQWAAMQSVATSIERAGYTSAWVYDHFHPVPEPTQEPVYEAWTLMAALAAVTSKVRLGQMCTCNSYRPPSYLAKVAATIDVISGGRLEMGIGAGWYEHEYTGYGYPFPKPSVRIGQLREGVEIMKRMWTEDVVDYAGDHYTLEGALCRPKPLQDPHIPLWIAGGGEQLTLRVAANHADYTNFGVDLDQFNHKSTVLAGHCDAVGRDFGSITRTSNFNVAIAETEAGVEALLQSYRDMYMPLFGAEMTEGMLQRNWIDGGGMAGTPQQIIERLGEWKEAGMGYAIVYFAEAAYDTTGLELFAREVVPALA